MEKTRKLQGKQVNITGIVLKEEIAYYYNLLSWILSIYLYYAEVRPTLYF